MKLNKLSTLIILSMALIGTVGAATIGHYATLSGDVVVEDQTNGCHSGTCHHGGNQIPYQQCEILMGGCSNYICSGQEVPT